MNLELEILNATADGWESLDQIYLSVCFEFDSDTYNATAPETARWKRRYSTFLLSEFVKTIQHLIHQQELHARWEDRSPGTMCSGDDILAGWFSMSQKGRERVEREWIE